MTRYAIRVVWKDGDEELLKMGTGDRVMSFSSKGDADFQRDFMLMGMADEVQSISVIRYPKGQSA